MKKRVFGRKLGRSRTARNALIRSLTRSLVLYGSITTTKAKAKAALPDIENLVKKAKESSVNSRKSVYAFLANDRKTTDALFDKIGPVFSNLTSGFVKLTNLPPRRGDMAEPVKAQWSRQVVYDVPKKEAKVKVEKKGLKRLTLRKKESVDKKTSKTKEKSSKK